MNNWLSPVHNSLGFGQSRQGQDGSRGYFVQIEPRMSISGAAADEWIPATPGTEGVLALGIAQRIVADGRYTGDDVDAWREALSDYTPAQVASRTGVSANTIAHLAEGLSQADAGLAIGGGAASSYTNGVDTLIAVNTLNYLLGNIGKPGGVVLNPASVTAQSATDRNADYAAIQDLIERARARIIDVLIVSDTDPVFTLPKTSGFREVLESIPMIVSLSSFRDDTTALADIILPSHTYLESWGDDMPEPGVGFSIGTISQPVVSPLYNTRNTGDIVLGLAEKLNLSDALPWQSMEEYLKYGWRQIYARSQSASGEPDESAEPDPRRIRPTRRTRAARRIRCVLARRIAIRRMGRKHAPYRVGGSRPKCHR